MLTIYFSPSCFGLHIPFACICIILYLSFRFTNYNLNLCVFTYLIQNVKKVIICGGVGGVNSEKFQQSLKLGTSWNDGLGYFPQ